MLDSGHGKHSERGVLQTWAQIMGWNQYRGTSEEGKCPWAKFMVASWRFAFLMLGAWTKTSPNFGWP